MKEFVEKLIERLEKLNLDGIRMIEDGKYELIRKKEAINIVNQLAEEYKPKTNADKIRVMSDEELAMNMMCPNENGLAEIECNKDDSCNCYECLLKWLQSEVEK